MENMYHKETNFRGCCRKLIADWCSVYEVCARNPKTPSPLRGVPDQVEDRLSLGKRLLSPLCLRL